MTAYTNKDIERVMRVSKLDRDGAEALLQRYGGRPERAISEGLGYEIVCVEPEAVVDRPLNPVQRVVSAVQTALGGATPALEGLRRGAVSVFKIIALPAALLLLMGRVFTQSASRRAPASY